MYLEYGYIIFDMEEVFVKCVVKECVDCVFVVVDYIKFNEVNFLKMFLIEEVIIVIDYIFFVVKEFFI